MGTLLRILGFVMFKSLNPKTLNPINPKILNPKTLNS